MSKTKSPTAYVLLLESEVCWKPLKKWSQEREWSTLKMLRGTVR